MRTLREPAIKQFIAMLDVSLFTQHGFSSTFNGKNGETVKIIFKENPEYFFIIKQVDEGRNWHLTECPGVTFTDEEVSSHAQFSQAQSRLSNWLQRIIEDFTISRDGEIDKLAAMRESLDKAANELPSPETPFDEQESKRWGDKLDNLVEQFEKFQEEEKIQKRELFSLKQEVAQLKSQIGAIPKKLWLKSAGNKVLNIFEKVAGSKIGKTLIEHTVKALLGDQGKSAS